MSYKSEDKELTVAAAKALLPHTSSPKWRNALATLYWVEKGMIFPGMLVETGLIEKSGGVLEANTDTNRTEDFNDYSDAKFLSVTNNCTKMAANAVKNKRGALRIVVFEPKQKKVYFFYVPRRKWKDYACGPNIPFKGDGTPKRRNHWWMFEVDSFKELARIKKLDWINIR